MPFGLPMENSAMLGLPAVVYQTLVEQSKAEGSYLIWTIGGHGPQVEVTLKWLPKGSKWEDPHVPPETILTTKHKSPGCRRRDITRKKWYNVNKNSVAVSTCDFDNNTSSDDMRPNGEETPISASNQSNDPSGESVDMSEGGSIEAQQPSSITHDQQEETSDHITEIDLNMNQNKNTIESATVLSKENYKFELFKKAVNDQNESVLYVLSIDNRIYNYYYGSNRTGPVCVLLERFCTESLQARISVNLSKDILENREPPFHDYLVCLHEFAKKDFVWD